MPVQTRTQIQLQCPSKWKSQVKRAASMTNRSVEEFILASTQEAAQKIILGEEKDAHVTLSDRDRDRFLALLDNPPAPNRALKKAVRLRKKYFQ